MILVFAILTVGCKESITNNMAFKQVDFVKKFPKSVTLKERTFVDIDVIGIRNFAIHDSLLIFSTIDDDGLWSFVSLNDYSILGNFLTIGEGPFQFLQPPSIATKGTLHTYDSLYAYIYDSQRGRLLKMNIDKSINDKALSISIVTDSIPPFLFNSVVIDSSQYLFKEASPDLTQQLRYLYHRNEKKTSEVLNVLNSAKIEMNEDINILSTITKAHNKNGKIVEMPIGLNHLNIYSLDGIFKKTVSVESKLNDINKIQQKSLGDRLYTFADLRLFDNYFGTLHINEKESIYQTNREKKPRILFFDYDGKPLIEINLEHHITSFDFDLNRGEMYTFDVHSDELYKYDIRQILQELR